MRKALQEIALDLKNANKKVQLIYAFNGSGKTRLSREFKELVAPKSEDGTDDTIKIIYYNAFTEDLFYWDNDLENDVNRKLKIQPNSFTKWVLEKQGQESNIASHFQHYTNDKLTPSFNALYTIQDKDGKNVIIPAYSEATFSYQRGDDTSSENVKISKGEESCFVWSVFYSLLEQVVEELNIPEPSDRDLDTFNLIEYVFIDDPVTSLDDNHLIELAVNLAEVIKNSKSELKFIITTHNPLFYNVLSNEFNNANKETGYKPNKDFMAYTFDRDNENNYALNNSRDTPFSYHLVLLNEIKKAVATDQISKYHFNFLRNILEKTATFLGYSSWAELLLPIQGEQGSYIRRILNISSHSKLSDEEVAIITPNDKRVFKYLVEQITSLYKFYNPK